MTSATSKKLLLSVASLLVLFVVCEVGARVLYYQASPRRTFAVHEAFVWLQDRVTKWRRDAEVQDATPFITLFGAADDHLYTEEAREMLAELEARYEADLVELVDAIRAEGSEFFLLNFQTGLEHPHGRFLARLVEKYDLDYLNVSEVLAPHPPEHRQLIPGDPHPTRFAFQLVAASVDEHLKRYANHTSGKSYSGTPTLLGDYPPDTDMVLSWHPRLGFRVKSNRHGLRMPEDLAVPKTRQRILCLGDSLTFGPHLNDQDTYPAILARRRPELEILNAGITGYTIADQKTLFLERARFAAPDVTILQVCHNDIVEQMAFIQSRMGRKQQAVEPSPAEKAYLTKLERDLERDGK